MIQLFEMIEKLLRGEYDLRGEKIITVTCDIAEAAEAARADLEPLYPEVADLLDDELYDIAEDYDSGTPEEGEEYMRRVKEVYERAKAMMSRGAAGE